jgi:phage terminase small subunit
MPKWSKQDERQYEHIKESTMERGDSEDTAQEIAARTVNKQRRKEGRTPNKTTQGTGNPNLTLGERTVHELRNIASELKIDGRSKMTKAELVQAISKNSKSAGAAAQA